MHTFLLLLLLELLRVNLLLRLFGFGTGVLVAIGSGLPLLGASLLGLTGRSLLSSILGRGLWCGQLQLRRGLRSLGGL